MIRLTAQNYLTYGLHTFWLLPLTVVFGMAASTVMGFSTTLGFVSMTAFLSDASLLTFTAMLAMTPIMIMTGWRWPQRLKKPLGLYAFSYSGIHFIIFSGGFNFQPADIISGAVSTAMLAAGSIAFLGLMPLAITSNRWSMQLLGRNWKRLHRLTYVVAIFILLHLFFLRAGFAMDHFIHVFARSQAPIYSQIHYQMAFRSITDSNKIEYLPPRISPCHGLNCRQGALY